MRGRTLVAAAVLGVTLTAVSSAPARPASPDAAQTVKVSMYEMGFKLSKSVIQRGTAVFRTVNDGAVQHDFRIKGIGTPMGKGTPILGSGERATLTVRFARKGRYTFICTVPGHAAAGMKGALTVK